MKGKAIQQKTMMLQVCLIIRVRFYDFSMKLFFFLPLQKNATSSNSTMCATSKRCKNLWLIRKKKVYCHRCHHTAKMSHHRGKYQNIIHCTFRCTDQMNAYHNRLALWPYHFVARLRWVTTVCLLKNDLNSVASIGSEIVTKSEAIAVQSSQ